MQAGRLRCGLPLFMEWSCRCSSVYLSPVCVYRWVSMCLQHGWQHSEYGASLCLNLAEILQR